MLHLSLTHAAVALGAVAGGAVVVVVGVLREEDSPPLMVQKRKSRYVQLITPTSSS